jgi:hypothetical protein
VAIVLKCASAFTYELDNPEKALNEIVGQLKNQTEFLENTVGIILCHTEFVEGGVLAYISGKLPFETVGATTASQAVNGSFGEMVLTVFVMTSDDVAFYAGITESLEEDIEGPVRLAYERRPEGFGAPGLAVIFPPLLIKHSGDEYIRVFEKVMPNTPLFGSIAVDDSVTFSGAVTVYNGRHYENALSFLFCCGNIHPRFAIAALPPNPVASVKGEITKSEGSRVYEINKTDAYSYLTSLEHSHNIRVINNMLMYPFWVDLVKRDNYDGVPVIRGLASVSEDGPALFRGDVDERSTFTLLTCNPQDVLKTTRECVDRVNKSDGINGVLFISCIVRRMTILSGDPLAELQAVKEGIKPGIPFMTGYAGGEICPTSVRDRIPTNRFHNYSLVVLVV